MEEARNYIHLQYYIIRNDELWQEIEKVLVRKVRQGVEVRVLFDSRGDVYKRQYLYRSGHTERSPEEAESGGSTDGTGEL